MERNMKEMFYKSLVKDSGFYMSQYKSEHNSQNKYIAVNNIEGISYVVLITDEVNENIDAYEAHDYLVREGKKFILNVVVIVDSPNSYVNSNNQINKLVIDKRGEVLLCSESCKPLMNIFFDLRNNNRQNRSEIFEYITLFIIIINVLVYLLSAFFSNDIFNINYQVLFLLGGNYAPSVICGQYFRLFTCMFLHGGIVHIACNMYSLFIIGPQIEKIYGKLSYVVIYFCAGILASIVSCVASPSTLSVGASGAIFGLIGALLAFACSERKRINKEYISGLIQVLIINLLIGFSIKNIDNSAHIGGAISGFIIGYIIYNISKIRSARR